MSADREQEQRQAGNIGERNRELEATRGVRSNTLEHARIRSANGSAVGVRAFFSGFASPSVSTALSFAVFYPLCLQYPPRRTGSYHSIISIEDTAGRSRLHRVAFSITVPLQIQFMHVHFLLPTKCYFQPILLHLSNMNNFYRREKLWTQV